MAFLEIHRENNPNIYYSEGDVSYPSHFHKNLEFLYALKDDVEVHLNNEKVMVKKGQLLIFDSFVIHHIIGKSYSISLCLPNVYLNDFFVFIGDKRFSKFIVNDADCVLLNEIRKFDGVNSKNVLIQRGIVNGFLGKLIDLVGIENQNNKSGDLINKVLIYLSQNYKDEHTLSSIANYLGYSKYTLSHKFKSFTGIDIREYLNQIRINAIIDEFYNLGESQKVNITTLCQEVGFSSVQTFYRVFKKRFLISPKEYLKKLMEV